MKRCKAEFSLRVISLNSSIGKGLPSKRLSGLSEETSTMHTCILMDISLSSGRLRFN